MTLKQLANHWVNPLIGVYFFDNAHVGASAGAALVDNFFSFFTLSLVCLLACSDFFELCSSSRFWLLFYASREGL